MDRRQVLALCGSAIAGIAGCATSRPAETTPPTDADHNTAPTTASQTPTPPESGTCLMDGAVSLTAGSDEFAVTTGDTTVETLVFTLSNQTMCPVTIDTHSWVIERQTDGDWRVVTTGGDGGTHRTLSNGEAHQWSLSLSEHPTPFTETTTFITADLAEGTFAFIVTATVENDDRITRRDRFRVTKRPSND